MKPARKCSVPSCDDDAVAAGLCRACYSGTRYWMRQGVAAAMKHRSKVQRIGERMELLQPLTGTMARRGRVKR